MIVPIPVTTIQAAARAVPGFHQVEPVGGSFGRRETRLMTILLVARLDVAGVDHVCRVRNLSQTGMMIECSAALAEEDRVRVELRNLQAVDARVAWVRDGRAGLQLDRPIVIDAVLGTVPDASPIMPRPITPRTPRIAANCPAVLWHQGTLSAAMLCDLSQSGCRMLVAASLPRDSPMPRDSEVRITIAGIAPRHAHLRWSNGESMGFAFLEMLSFAEMSAWQIDRSVRFASARAEA